MVRRILAIMLLACAFVAANAQGEVVGEVVVRGAKAVPETSIRAVMLTREGQIYQQSQLAKDKSALDRLGLFQDVQVFGQLLETNRWRVIVEVVEWPIVSDVQISGSTIFTKDELLTLLKTKKGEIFNTNNLDSDASKISEMYRKKGLYAKVSKYEPVATDKSVITIEISEVRVGKINFKGLKRTRVSTMRRLMDTREGDLLNSTVFTNDLRRIVDTRWFTEMKPETTEPTVGVVDVDLTLAEDRSGNFNVGVQLDPRNRLAGLLQINETNLAGTGRTVGINFVQSAQGLGTSLTLEYADPFIDNRRSSLSVSVYSRESLVFGASIFGGGSSPTGQRFAQRRSGANVSLSRVLRQDTRATIGFQMEGIDSKNFVLDPGEEFVVQDGTNVGLNLAVTRNRRDNSVDPAKGDFARISLEPSFSRVTSVGGFPAGFDIIGDNFYNRLTFDYRAYFSKGPRRPIEKFDDPRQVLALRLQGGLISGSVPFYDQFFIGGSSGIRGYAEDRFWGKNMLMFQVEFRQPIQKAFNAIAFVDIGSAWGGYGDLNEFTQTNDINLKLGYGVGVNFRTAFGPIRLDLGVDDKGKTRTHFLIGGSF